MCRKNESVVLLIGPDVAGFVSGLEFGFKELKWKVVRIGRQRPHNHRMTEATPNLSVIGKARLLLVRIFLAIDNSKVPCWMRSAIRVVEKSLRSLVGFVRLVRWWAVLSSCDLVIFNSGQTLSGSSLDYRIARRGGARIVTVFHGSDARPAYLDGAVWRGKDVAVDTIRRRLDLAQRRVRRAEKFADAIVCWVGITHLFSRPLFLHETVGFPLRTSPNVIQQKFCRLRSPDSKPLVISHHPTDKAAKGTSEIERLVAAVVNELQDVKFLAKTDCSHDEVLSSMADSDIVIDQVFSDSAFSVTVAEASILGVPVLIAGKDSTLIRSALSEPSTSTLFVHTDDAQRELKYLCESKDLRIRVAVRAQTYFAAKWDPVRVASRYVELSLGNSTIPACDPLGLHEVRGGFAPESELREVLFRFTHAYGVAALGLHHNPNLRQNVVNWMSKT